MDKTRIPDLQYLEERLRNPMVSADEKEQARRGIAKILKESKDIRNMRTSLVREVRAGRVDNVKDIHDYIQGKLKYQNYGV
jgi:hypothetical protein